MIAWFPWPRFVSATANALTGDYQQDDVLGVLGSSPSWLTNESNILEGLSTATSERELSTGNALGNMEASLWLLRTSRLRPGGAGSSGRMLAMEKIVRCCATLYGGRCLGRRDPLAGAPGILLAHRDRQIGVAEQARGLLAQMPETSCKPRIPRRGASRGIVLAARSLTRWSLDLRRQHRRAARPPAGPTSRK